MSGGRLCTCKPQDRSKWVVLQLRCNYSAFNGYHRTPSDYSSIRCLTCGEVWRTKAQYVWDTREATRAERFAPASKGGE